MDITLCDVGPRDGLQNETTILPARTRAELIRRLADAGVPRVETASFVNPKLVPAMAQAEDVFAAVSGYGTATYTGLVLNDRGYDRAVAAGVQHLRYGFTVTDEFGLKNQNQTTAQGLEIARRMVARAHDEGRTIGVTLMVSFGCPFAGSVAEGRVMSLVENLMDDPPDEIQLADTIGVGVPTQVRRMVREMARMEAPAGVHFHNTRNTGIANALTAVEEGVKVVDASVGGTGGCPFAPEATGNIPSEDLVYALHQMGVETGIELDGLIDTSHWLGEQLQKKLPGLVAQAGAFPIGEAAEAD